MGNRHHCLSLRRSLLAAGLATALGGSTAIADDAVPDHGWARQQAVPIPAFLERVEQFRQARRGDAGATRGTPTGPTLVVSNCNDAGSGSLREAASLVTIDETTIDLSDLACSPITLVSGAVQIPGFSVYLTGPGAEALTIDANQASRVLEAEGSLYVESLTLANGKTTDYGGCVYVAGAFVAKYSVITGCETGGASVYESYGGAVAAGGSAALANSTVTGNSVSAQVFAAGGGIASLGPIVAVYSSRIENNTAFAIGSAPPLRGGGAAAGAAGGGMWSGAFMAIGYDSHVTGNTAQTVDGFARGGGVLVASDYAPAPPVAGSPSGHGDASRGGKYGLVTAYLSTIDGNHVISANGPAMGGGIQAGDLIGPPPARLGSVSTVGSPPYLYGQVQLQSSTISGNSADGAFVQGGGINAFGPISAGYSTVSGNLATTGKYGRGGGISTYIAGGVELRNTTVSGNSAMDPGNYSRGGGIFVHEGGFMSLYNSTVAGNAAGSGGGIFFTPVSAPLRGIVPTLVSTIVADNQAPSAADVGAATATNFGGDHNLVESAGANVTLPPDTLNADPLLQPLRGNGGPTATHALLACSPAIDNGSNPQAFSWDQRGEPFSRTWAANQDIGAFELQPNADVIFRNGFDPDPC